MSKQINMRLSEVAQEQIKQIRERYNLKSDIAAVEFALNETAWNSKPMTRLPASKEDK